MNEMLKTSADAILRAVVTGLPCVPGVVAAATDGNGMLYQGVAGRRALGCDASMTPDTVFAVFSTSKAITATACLQLHESGEIDLDAPARTYAPGIGELGVLEGFDADGQPLLRTPRRDITTRMLLLHTSGLAYDVFNKTYQRLARDHGQPSTKTSVKASLFTPLLFDPGDAWEYGSGIDWAGQVVEGATGKRLGEYLRQRIFEPLEMSSTGFLLDDSKRSRLARLHQREPSGEMRVMVDHELPQDPEVQMGGHGLYSTVPDYCRFIRMWLNDGVGPNGRVLQAETIRMAAQNGLGDKKIKCLPGVNPRLANDAEFFPGQSKSWGLSFMINDEDAPTGRSAGSLSWAGLANLYYWIDRKQGVGGFWATQVFPFADPTSMSGFLDFETAVYDSLVASKAA